MGAQSSTGSLVRIFHALMRQNTWRQAELAQEVGLHVPALRRCMLELQGAGIPVHRDHEPPNVFWSIPSNWLPGGVILGADDSREVVRHLLRAPRSAARDQILRRLTRASPGSDAAAASTTVETSASRWADQLEDAAQKGAVLLLSYRSARGAIDDRVVSVQRVVFGEVLRVVGWCHRDAKLKWWRADRIVSAAVVSERAFVRRPGGEVEAWVAESVSHFRDGARQTHAFVVAADEAAWVRSNLPQCTSREEQVPDGLRIVVEGSGLVPLARFVVGLGGAARCESEALRDAVRELAQAALRRNQGDDAEG
jgi:predicted DNA-binding transcriptional regulator YafY